MCLLCDCCQETTIVTCRVFFVIYIVVFITLVIALICYNFQRVKIPRRPGHSTVGQSKVAITICVSLWLVARILYFSMVFFDPMNMEFGRFACILEVVQNLPVFLMYVCFMVFHRFMLRVWCIMIYKDTPRRYFWVSVYFWVFTAIYFISQSLQTSVICIDYTLDSNGVWKDFFKYKGTVIISTMLSCHLAISYLVFPEFKKQITYSSVTWYAIFISAVFIGIMIYREYITIY